MSPESRARVRAAWLAALLLVAGCSSQPSAPVSVGVERIAGVASGSVDSLRPTLRWPPVSARPPGTSRLTYDLRVWRVEGGYPVELAYVREALPEPHHTLAEPLQPATEYAWSSRARLEVEGQVRLTDWRVTYGTRFGVLPHPLYPRFRTPGE